MTDDTKWTITPEDVEWEMTWGKHLPEKPPTEMIFEEEGALAHLLMNGVCCLNNFWHEYAWPESAKKCINVFVSCGDTFAYACADAERLHYDQIQPLYRMWAKDPTWGPTAWVVMQRKERPIPPVEKALRDHGYDVDSWGLRDNASDAETQAAFAYAAAKRRGDIP